MKSDFFLKVLHEEPLDKVSLEAIKGGDCTCNGGSCNQYCASNGNCTCDGLSCYNYCKCNAVMQCPNNGGCPCNNNYKVTD